MIVAVSTTNENLEIANVDPRFGRCSMYLIINSKDLSFYALKNKAQFEGHGAGIAAAQSLINENIDAVISGNIGPNAFQTFQAAKVKMYTFSGSVMEAIKTLQDNKIPELKEPRKAAGMGAGMGRGRSQGQGQGRGRR